jgi:hypothetical protein
VAEAPASTTSAIPDAGCNGEESMVRYICTCLYAAVCGLEVSDHHQQRLHNP